MMSDMIRIMLSTFQESKEQGSYILFYLLALGLGLAVAWDRYGKTKMEDNWMVEEAKKQIQLWPFLYGLLALLLVVMNPLIIWLFNKKTPMAGQYHKIWGLLLFLFLCAYGIVCFLSILRERKQIFLVVFGFVMLIGLAGSSYGLTAERPGKGDYSEEEGVAGQIKEYGDEYVILGTEPFLEYVGVWEPQMKVLYGKDMYIKTMDLGMLDVYPDEVIRLYELMRQPKGSIGEISKRASMCGCDVIVTGFFEDSPDKAGDYYKKKVTEKYIVYIREKSDRRTFDVYRISE